MTNENPSMPRDMDADPTNPHGYQVPGVEPMVKNTDVLPDISRPSSPPHLPTTPMPRVPRNVDSAHSDVRDTPFVAAQTWPADNADQGFTPQVPQFASTEHLTAPLAEATSGWNNGLGESPAPGFTVRRENVRRDAANEYADLEFGLDMTDADRNFLYRNGDPAAGYQRHKFYEFMGMRPEFLARYPQERAAVWGRFSLVFVTVICSFFGMFYTMYLAFNNSGASNAGLIGAAIAFVFAAIIFIIDLSIIRDFSVPKGLRKDFSISDFKTSGFGRNLFRVLISICIAVIVSHSLVIFFFRSDIQANLAEYNKTFEQGYVSQQVGDDVVYAQDIKKLNDAVAAQQTALDAATAVRDAQQICLTNERAGLSNSDVAPEQRCTIGTTSGTAGRAAASIAREQALAAANLAVENASTTLASAKNTQATGTTKARDAAEARAQATYVDGGKRESLIDQSKAFVRVANDNKAEVYPIALAIVIALMAIDLLPLVAKYTLKTPMHNTHLANLMLRTVSGSEAMRRTRQHRNQQNVDYDNSVYTQMAREESKRIAEMERIRNRELVTRFAHSSQDLNSDHLVHLDVSRIDQISDATAGLMPLPDDLRSSAPELSRNYIRNYDASPAAGGYQPRVPGHRVDREILWETVDGHEQLVGSSRVHPNNSFISQFDAGNPEQPVSRKS